MKTCRAKQFSDEMLCKRCDLRWDTNDPHPPQCKPFSMEDAAKHLAEFFKEDPSKITWWWFTPNNNIGGVSPAQLYVMRPEKLLKWMENLINGDIA